MLNGNNGRHKQSQTNTGEQQQQQKIAFNFSDIFLCVFNDAAAAVATRFSHNALECIVEGQMRARACVHRLRSPGHIVSVID